MKFCKLLRFGHWLALCAIVASSSSLGANRPEEPAEEVAKAEFPQWHYFITITPEEIKAARSAPDCRPADQDSQGHWGPSWEGDRLSIRLNKEVFTNGEPIMACVTVRNASYRISYLECSLTVRKRTRK